MLAVGVVTFNLLCFLMILFYFRSGALTDLIRSAPSLQLKKCFVDLVLLVFGIELLVGVDFISVSFC